MFKTYYFFTLLVFLFISGCSDKKEDSKRNSEGESKKMNSPEENMNAKEPLYKNLKDINHRESEVHDESYSKISTISKYNLRKDLEKYNGFYSIIEYKGGTLNLANLPAEMKDFHDVELLYLGDNSFGYTLTFTLNKENFSKKVISTLDSNYNLVDFKIFPNGNENLDLSNDTITYLRYNHDKVIVEMLRPSEDEPSYALHGIKQEKFSISKNLMFNLNK